MPEDGNYHPYEDNRDNEGIIRDELRKRLATTYDVYEQACCYQIHSLRDGQLTATDYVPDSATPVSELLRNPALLQRYDDQIDDQERPACNRKKRIGLQFLILDDDVNNYFRFIGLNSCQLQRGVRSQTTCEGRYTWFYDKYAPKLPRDLLDLLTEYFHKLVEQLHSTTDKATKEREAAEISRLLETIDLGHVQLKHQSDDIKKNIFKSPRLTLPYLIKLYQSDPEIFYTPAPNTSLTETLNNARNLFNNAFNNVPPLPRNLMVFRCDKTRSLTQRPSSGLRSIFAQPPQRIAPGNLSLEFNRLLSTTVSQYSAISSEFCYVDDNRRREEQPLFQRRTLENAALLGNCKEYEAEADSVLAILIPKGSRVIPIYPPGSFETEQLARKPEFCRKSDVRAPSVQTNATSFVGKHEKEVILPLNGRLLYTGFCYKSPLDLFTNYLPLLIYIDPNRSMNPEWQGGLFSKKYGYEVNKPDYNELLDLFEDVAKGFNRANASNMAQFEQIYSTYTNPLSDIPPAREQPPGYTPPLYTPPAAAGTPAAAGAPTPEQIHALTGALAAAGYAVTPDSVYKALVEAHGVAQTAFNALEAASGIQALQGGSRRRKSRKRKSRKRKSRKRKRKRKSIKRKSRKRKFY